MKLPRIYENWTRLQACLNSRMLQRSMHLRVAGQLSIIMILISPLLHAASAQCTTTSRVTTRRRAIGAHPALAAMMAAEEEHMQAYLHERGAHKPPPHRAAPKISPSLDGAAQPTLLLPRRKRVHLTH